MTGLRLGTLEVPTPVVLAPMAGITNVAFRKLCRERGLVTLRTDGFSKVLKGLTTVDEILRVTENAA